MKRQLPATVIAAALFAATVASPVVASTGPAFVLVEITDTPTPVVHVGDFDSGLACQNAQIRLAEALQTNHPPTGQTVALQCLPSSVPDSCAASPSECYLLTPPPLVIQR